MSLVILTLKVTALYVRRKVNKYLSLKGLMSEAAGRGGKARYGSVGSLDSNQGPDTKYVIHPLQGPWAKTRVAHDVCM